MRNTMRDRLSAALSPPPPKTNAADNRYLDLLAEHDADADAKAETARLKAELADLDARTLKVTQRRSEISNGLRGWRNDETRYQGQLRNAESELVEIASELGDIEARREEIQLAIAGLDREPLAATSEHIASHGRRLHDLEAEVARLAERRAVLAADAPTDEPAEDLVALRQSLAAAEALGTLTPGDLADLRESLATAEVEARERAAAQSRHRETMAGVDAVILAAQGRLDAARALTATLVAAWVASEAQGAQERFSRAIEKAREPWLRGYALRELARRLGADIPLAKTDLWSAVPGADLAVTKQASVQAETERLRALGLEV